MSDLTRRGFLAGLPAAAALLKGGALLAQQSTLLGGANMQAVGVQLYTLRDVMSSEPEGTLAALAEIGYREVELAGLYGWTPREMRSRLDSVGLRAASSHHSVQDVRERWPETLEGAQELGQSLIVVPSIPSAEQSPDALRRVADDFNRAGEAARAAGMRFGYHNHAWEVEPLEDGTRRMDLLLELCEPELVDWQMDVFWTVHGGADPMAYLRENPGRVTSVHIKDRTSDGTMVAVGDGVIDFGTVLAAANAQGLLHGFVEHDNPGDSVESVRRSFRTVNGLGVVG